MQHSSPSQSGYKPPFPKDHTMPGGNECNALPMLPISYPQLGRMHSQQQPGSLQQTQQQPGSLHMGYKLSKSSAGPETNRAPLPRPLAPAPALCSTGGTTRSQSHTRACQEYGPLPVPPAQVTHNTKATAQALHPYTVALQHQQGQAVHTPAKHTINIALRPGTYATNGINLYRLEDTSYETPTSMNMPQVLPHNYNTMVHRPEDTSYEAPATMNMFKVLPRNYNTTMYILEDTSYEAPASMDTSEINPYGHHKTTQAWYSPSEMYKQRMTEINCYECHNVN